MKKQSNITGVFPAMMTHRNKIIPDPHTFSYSIGKGADDGCHFMYDGYREWLSKIKHQLNLPR